MSSNIRQIFRCIEESCVNESIQELVRDMKATQHGDRVNPFYELVKDHHKEGGVWKHTSIALDSLPEIAHLLSEVLVDPEYEQLYGEFKNELRAAILYHDIGKIVTKVPSSQRTGSFSFPGHADEATVGLVASEYDLSIAPLVKWLIVHHHDSPVQTAKIQGDNLKLLILLKAVDAVAVGPKTGAEAVDHVRQFVVS